MPFLKKKRKKKKTGKIGFFMRKDSKYIVDRLGIGFKEMEYKIEQRIHPLLDAFDAMGIYPNILTMIHFLLGILAVVFLVKGNHGLFVTFLLLSTFVDMFDGMLARHTKRTSTWGAGFDLLADLTVGMAVIAALGYSTGMLIEAGIALATMFYQEWVYVLILTIGYSRVPLHSFRPSYLIAAFGFYEAAISFNIWLNVLGSLLGLIFFFQVGWKLHKERTRARGTEKNKNRRKR